MYLATNLKSSAKTLCLLQPALRLSVVLSTYKYCCNWHFVCCNQSPGFSIILSNDLFLLSSVIISCTGILLLPVGSLRQRHFVCCNQSRGCRSTPAAFRGSRNMRMRLIKMAMMLVMILEMMMMMRAMSRRGKCWYWPTTSFHCPFTNWFTPCCK